MRKWRIEDSEELYNITGWGVSKGRGGCGSEGIGGRTSA